MDFLQAIADLLRALLRANVDETARDKTSLPKRGGARGIYVGFQLR